MLLLALNYGSATVKSKLFRADAGAISLVAARNFELQDGYGHATRAIIADLAEPPDVVVHRVVHGGDRFREPVLIDDDVIAHIERMVPFAPLHNPAALEGIRAAAKLGRPMVAFFDTAFHQTIPERAWRYAIPKKLADEYHIRRYGFHGISHQYVMEKYAEIAESHRPTIVTMHLGNGCSAAAIKEGRCVDTSMGFSPLEGLVMGTRAGDMDAAVVTHLIRRGFSADEIEDTLEHRSGLLGLGGTNDMRELLRREDAEAQTAVEIFCYRARKYVGAFLAALQGAEAVVFTGGIGERAPEIRARILDGFRWAGLEIDEEKNRADGPRITTMSSRLHAWVIPTDEELLMAREAVKLLQQ